VRAQSVHIALQGVIDLLETAWKQLKDTPKQKRTIVLYKCRLICHNSASFFERGSQWMTTKQGARGGIEPDRETVRQRLHHASRRREVVKDIQVVSTGSLGLDIALGVGGLPRGRVVEIYGPESSGKTTLTLQVIAEMQKLGARRPSSMRSTRSTRSMRKSSCEGRRLADLAADTGEQALEIADMLVRSARWISW